MSIKALNWAFDQTVPMAEKFALVVLANYADDKHSCFPSQQRIATDMGASVTTARRSVKALEERGLVRRQKRGKDGGGRTSDRYVLAVEPTSPIPTNKTAKGGVTGQSDRFIPVNLEGVTGQIDRGTTTEPPVEPLSDASAAAEAPKHTAQTLVAEWIDNYQGTPPKAVIGHLSGQIKKLLDEGHQYPRVREAVMAWAAKGVHPSVLPSVLHELTVKRANQTNRPHRITGRMDF